MTTGRRHDIDWLRLLATAIVLVFHSSRYFDHLDWHVKNPERSTVLMVVVAFLVQWMMPLFFVISGMSSVFVLQRRSMVRYLLDRVPRLLVPFLLGTFVVLVPVQVWIERVTQGGYEGGFLSFYPHYFDGWYAFGGNFAWMGLHLWYLLALFLMSVQTVLPLRGLLLPSVSTRLARLASIPGGILLLGVALVGSEWLAAGDPDGMGKRDFGGWSLVTYMVYFVLGAVLASDDRWRQATERTHLPALVLAVGLTVLEVRWVWADDALFASPAVSLITRAFCGWSWVVALVGLAARHLREPHAVLQYGNEAVLPFYVVHQTVIVCLGYVMIDWDIVVVWKFPLLLLSSFVVIMATYHYGIRPYGPIRWLFGMRRARA